MVLNIGGIDIVLRLRCCRVDAGARGSFRYSIADGWAVEVFWRKMAMDVEFVQIQLRSQQDGRCRGLNRSIRRRGLEVEENGIYEFCVFL